MNKQIINGLILTLLSLLSGAAACAEINEHIIQCPYPSAIKSSASMLDAGDPDEYGDYRVYTSKPAFYRENMPWHVIVLTPHNRLGQALTRGQEIVQLVDYPQYDNAEVIGEGTYICYYIRDMLSQIVIAVGGKFNGPDTIPRFPFNQSMRSGGLS